MTAWSANTGGTRYTLSQLASTLTTSYTDPDPLVTVAVDIYEAVVLDGSSAAHQETSRRIKFRAGQIVRTSAITSLFQAPVNPTVNLPLGLTTLLVAGGQTVTIKADRGLLGATGVTFGGTAGTSLTQIDDKTLTVVAPAKTAGAVAVVLADDSGSVALGNVTYA